MSQIYYPTQDDDGIPPPPYHESKQEELLKVFGDKSFVKYHVQNVLSLLKSEEESRVFMIDVYEKIFKNIP